MKRRLFSIAAALSLLLNVSLIAVTVFSFSYFCCVAFYSSGKNSYALSCDSGRFVFNWQHSERYTGIATARYFVSGQHSRVLPAETWLEAIGFSCTSGQERAVYYWSIGVPAWFLILVTAALPTRRFAPWFRNCLRTKTETCVKCGYDMRATPTRCPECGTEPATAAR